MHISCKIGDLVEIIDEKNFPIRRIAVVIEKLPNSKHVFRIRYVEKGVFSEPVWKSCFDFHKCLA